MRNIKLYILLLIIFLQNASCAYPYLGIDCTTKEKNIFCVAKELYDPIKKYGPWVLILMGNQLVSIEVPPPEIKIVADPNNQPVNEKYYNSVHVVIEATNSEDQIYFSKDGSDPIGENSTSYEKGKEIEIIGGKSSETVIARAYRPSIDKWSSPSELKISFDVSPPEFTPKGNTYNTDKTIQISSKSNKAKCYYTQDNSDPSEDSTYYSAGIEITGDGTNITIKSMCIWGDLKSNIISSEYTIDYQSIDLWNGIVSYYPFNGNARDESGVNSNDGVLTGSQNYETNNINSKFTLNNKIFNFDGSSFFAIPTTNFPSGNNAVTLVAWVKQNSISTSNRHYVVGYGANLENKEFRMGFNEHTDGDFCLENYANGWISNSKVQANQWYHFVTTYDGNGNITFYENGINIGIKSTWGTPSVNTTLENGKIGARGDNTSPMNGLLDEIRVYNRELNN